MRDPSYTSFDPPTHDAEKEQAMEAADAMSDLHPMEDDCPVWRAWDGGEDADYAESHHRCICAMFRHRMAPLCALAKVIDVAESDLPDLRDAIFNVYDARIVLIARLTEIFESAVNTGDEQVCSACGHTESCLVVEPFIAPMCAVCYAETLT